MIKKITHHWVLYGIFLFSAAPASYAATSSAIICHEYDEYEEKDAQLLRDFFARTTTTILEHGDTQDRDNQIRWSAEDFIKAFNDDKIDGRPGRLLRKYYNMHCSLIALREGRVVGFIVGGLCNAYPPFNEDGLRLSHLIIDSEAGPEVAPTLLRSAARYAIEHGRSTLTTEILHGPSLRAWDQSYERLKQLKFKTHSIYPYIARYYSPVAEHLSQAVIEHEPKRCRAENPLESNPMNHLKAWTYTHRYKLGMGACMIGVTFNTSCDGGVADSAKFKRFEREWFAFFHEVGWQ